MISARCPKATTYHPEDDLFDLLGRLKEANAVLIVNGEEELVGIVTSYDTTEYFRQRLEDMMLVEDVESWMRDQIQDLFCNEVGETDQNRLGSAIQEITSSRRERLTIC